MNKPIKVFSAFIFFIFIISSLNVYAATAVKIPENVRVGLYFTDSVSHMDTAIGSFCISTTKGVKVGFLRENSFVTAFEESTKNIITVRKDTYYINQNDTWEEYDPKGNIAANVPKIGPFHLKIGDGSDDINVAAGQLQAIKQKGVQAYLAYADKWEIWTGFYTDQDSAMADIQKTVIPKLGEVACTAVQPSANRIIALKSNGETAFAFGSDSAVFQVRPKDENKPYVFTLNDTAYRGYIEARRIAGSDMTVINILPLEEYLYGVVPYEIGSSAHPEALKAQAVAARTYTLNNMSKFGKYFFDVCTTTSCQVYRGYSGETEKTNKAVDDTKGKVITYNGKVAYAFFFSSSGGRTEDVKNVWGSDIPYLVSVEDNYESGTSRYYNWESVYTADELKRLLQGMQKDVGDILSVEVTKVSEAGRAIELVVKGTKDECIFSLEDCRYKFSLLRSQWYTITTDADISIKTDDNSTVKTQLGSQKVMTSKGAVEVKTKNENVTVLGANNQKYTVSAVPTRYVFTGKGWGHAVGMSQEGAKGMALNGVTYDKILMHYFPGTKVE